MKEKMSNQLKDFVDRCTVIGDDSVAETKREFFEEITLVEQEIAKASVFAGNANASSKETLISRRAISDAFSSIVANGVLESVGKLQAAKISRLNERIKRRELHLDNVAEREAAFQPVKNGAKKLSIHEHNAFIPSDVMMMRVPYMSEKKNKTIASKSKSKKGRKYKKTAKSTDQTKKKKISKKKKMGEQEQKKFAARHSNAVKKEKAKAQKKEISTSEIQKKQIKKKRDVDFDFYEKGEQVSVSFNHSVLTILHQN